MQLDTISDVIIIGGSYAGLSAAMALGRSLRKVLVIDSGQPCNSQTPHSHNFLTRDGQTPLQISSVAREQVLKYPSVHLLKAKATTAQVKQDYFVAETESGEQYKGKKLLLATGVTDLIPPLAGLSECWGISVLHCPYCHGYEVQGEKIGLLANGDTGFELFQLIHNWSKDLHLLTNGRSTFSDEQRRIIDHYNIPIIEQEIASIVHEKGYVRRIQFTDNTAIPLKALFARFPFRQHTSLAAQVGCEMLETGLIKCDEFGKTTIKGVYVAGDNSTLYRSIAVAVANGTKTGAFINRELIEEFFA